jgi:predicted ester cyclase
MQILENVKVHYVLITLTRAYIRGIKDYKQHISEFYSAFPDLHFTINGMVAEGDKVAVRLTGTGTNKGAFMGSPPTNKKITVWEI